MIGRVSGVPPGRIIFQEEQGGPLWQAAGLWLGGSFGQPPVTQLANLSRDLTPHWRVFCTGLNGGWEKLLNTGLRHLQAGARLDLPGLFEVGVL